MIVRPESDLAGIRAALSSKLDFGRVLALAELHGVRPTLADCLARLGTTQMPADAKALLDAFHSRHLLQTLITSAEVCRIARLFTEQHIRFAMFKGPMLAIILEGNPGGREFADVDILVPLESVEAAGRLLESSGYMNPQGSWAFRRMFLAPQGQYDFYSPGASVQVDLHWDFTRRFLPFPLKPDEVWRDVRPVTVASLGIPSVTGANLALLLAGHGTKERWAKLKWIRDYAMVIDRWRDLDWVDIHRRARRHGSGDSVLLGCSVAQEVLGVAAPDGLRTLVDRSDRVLSLTAECVETLQTADATTQNSFDDLALCDRRIDRIKATTSLLMTPSAGDFQAMPLPQVLWPLFFMTRPFRLLGKAFSRIRHLNSFLLSGPARRSPR